MGRRRKNTTRTSRSDRMDVPPTDALPEMKFAIAEGFRTVNMTGFVELASSGTTEFSSLGGPASVDLASVD